MSTHTSQSLSRCRTSWAMISRVSRSVDCLPGVLLLLLQRLHLLPRQPLLYVPSSPSLHHHHHLGIASQLTRSSINQSSGELLLLNTKLKLLRLHLPPLLLPPLLPRPMPRPTSWACSICLYSSRNSQLHSGPHSRPPARGASHNSRRRRLPCLAVPPLPAVAVPSSRNSSNLHSSSNK